MSAEVLGLSENRERKMMHKVDILIQHGAHEMAIRYCDDFIKAKPESFHGYAVKHEIHMKMRDYEASLQDANHALRNTGNKRGGIFLKLLSLNQILEKSRLFLVSPSSLEKERGYAEELRKTAKRALTQYRGDTQIACTIAECYQVMGMKDEAISALDGHLQINPGDVHCLYLLALIYHEEKQYEKALFFYDRSLKSIEKYSQVFKDNFSKLISGSRKQALKATNRVALSGSSKKNISPYLPSCREET